MGFFMKLKGIILVGLMLLILTVGAVSAYEDANDTMSADEIDICENPQTTDFEDTSLESIDESPASQDDATVSFNSTGGEGVMTDLSIAKGSNFTLPESQFSKINRTFYGWNVGDAIRQPGENITVADNIAVKAVWRYDINASDAALIRNNQVNNIVDSSLVWVDGWLVLTDLRTGEETVENITVGPMPATYEFADYYNVSGIMINETISLLMDLAQSLVKDKNFSIINTEISDDHYFDWGDNITSFIVDLYEGGDGLVKSVKLSIEEGNCSTYWYYWVVINAEFESDPVKNISTAVISMSKNSFTYNAKVQKPTVTVLKGTLLNEGTDYIVEYLPDNPKNVGTYTVTVIGKGNYTGSAKALYKIDKASNPLKVKGKTVKIKFSTLKKKTQSLAVSKIITFTKKGQGTMTYSKSSGNSKIAVNKKTGKITIKKGLKKGTYKVKIKVKANGNANYKASSLKTLTCTIKIV